jgi:hypothetical protein
MPLTTDPSGAFVVEQFEGVKFAMFDEKKRVLCRASWEGLQDRAAQDHADQRDVGGTFKKYRTKIENVASEHYDRGEANPLVRSGEF